MQKSLRKWYKQQCFMPRTLSMPYPRDAGDVTIDQVMHILVAQKIYVTPWLINGDIRNNHWNKSYLTYTTFRFNRLIPSNAIELKHWTATSRLLFIVSGNVTGYCGDRRIVLITTVLVKQAIYCRDSNASFWRKNSMSPNLLKIMNCEMHSFPGRPSNGLS